MTTVPISAVVQVNGRPLASTAARYPHEKTALEGLTVRWGRASRLSQPSPSTATVKVALKDPAADLAALHIGAELTIIAEYETTSTGSEVIIKNDTSRASHVPPSPGAPVMHQVAPGAFSTNPAAWDWLPRIEYGSIIQGRVDVTMPPGSTLHVYALYWSAPWNEAMEVGEKVLTSTMSGRQSFTFKPDTKHAGKWVSLRMVVDPVGSTFAQTRTTWSAHPVTWDSLRTVWMSNLYYTRPDGATHTATVFNGRITDAPLEFDDAAQRPVVTLTAVDFTAELANRRVGDEPWQSESIAARFNRILRAARVSHLRAILPAVAYTRTLAAVDIDSRPALELLTNAAKAAGCILWAAAHDTIGSYIRLENPLERHPLYRLDVPAQGAARLEAASNAATRIDARELDLERLIVEQDSTDLASSVAVRWKDLDSNGRRVERTEKAEAPARAASHGYRSISISTDLNNVEHAQALARDTLDRAAPGSWTIPAATWRPKTTPASTVIKLLDATHRLGRPLVLDGVDDWVPGAPAIPVYLDGGAYTYIGGAWVLALNLTRASAPGASVQWSSLPASLTWQRLPLTWLDLSTATI